MNKTFKTILVAVLATSLISCNEEKSNLKCDPVLVHATVSVSGGPSGTKATGVTATQEDKVSNLQLYVFDENGMNEYYVNAGGQTNGEVIVEEGKKSIVAIVNAPEMNNITRKTDLYNKTSKLSDNSLGSFVMTGEVEATVRSGSSISIDVTRLVSKVSIQKITSAFHSSVYASKEFKVNSIYLINVAGNNTYSGTSEPTLWYNKLYNGTNDSGASSYSLLSDTVNKTIAFKSSYTTGHSFYCYPNPTVNENFGSTWCARHTMLVVDAMLDGKQTYYPIELPVIGRNKSLIIKELIITRKGSDYPYVPVPDGTCNISVEVVDWNVILNTTETI